MTEIIETRNMTGINLQSGDEDKVLVVGDGDAYYGYSLSGKYRFRDESFPGGSTDIRRVENTDLLAISNSGASINFVNMKTMKAEFMLENSNKVGTIRTVCSHQNLVFGETNQEVVVYDVNKKEKVGLWKVHETPDTLWVKVMHYATKRNHVCLPTNNGGFMLLDVEKDGKKVIEVKSIHTDGGVLNTPVDNKRDLLFTLSEDGSFGVFSQKTGELVKRVEAEGDLRTIILYPQYFGEGTFITNTGKWNNVNNVCVWDWRTWKLLKKIPKCHSMMITSLLPRGDDTFLSCSWDGSIGVFNSTDGSFENHKIFNKSRNLNAMYPYGLKEAIGRLLDLKIDEDMKERKEYLIECHSEVKSVEVESMNWSFKFPKIFLHF